MPATLPKKERLSGKTAIAVLTGRGKWDHTPHLRCCCLSGTGTGLNRIMVSVPKRYFKRAVRRNLLKRRLREAYRLQKDLLEEPGHDILFVYNNAEVVEFSVIFGEVGDLLKRIAR
ncbi:MAG: ribonuclease P protein component [Bacteroidales bacterium]|nr:ribonuclease P protein component [Bacteroidales bacterium]